MVFAFDTLSYARFLRDRGVSQEHAEAHAEAARQYVMAELVTKQNLLLARQDLQEGIARLDAKLDRFSRRLDTGLDYFFIHLDTQLENIELRLTIRFGLMLATAIGAFAALFKLT